MRNELAGEPLGQELLALLGALAALALRTAEEVGELVVTVALGVLDVVLQAKRIAQLLLGEPDDVVVLVLRAGDLAGLLGSTHWSSRRSDVDWPSCYPGLTA